MTARTSLRSLVGLVGTLALASPLRAQVGNVSGTLTTRGARVVNATVALTAFREQACAELAARTDRSKAEDDRLAACRTESARTMHADRLGHFEFQGLPPGWYALTASWTYGNFLVSCPGRAGSGWTVRNVAQGDDYGVRATSAPFELKAGDRLARDFDWCS
jgi:hypothetical protein